jgi:hypothetical protein
MAKNRIRDPYYLNAFDTSGGNAVGKWLRIDSLDNIGFQAVWAAGVKGTFLVEVSNDDYLSDRQTNLPDGRLGPSALTLPTSMTGADATPDGSTAGDFYFGFNQIEALWIRFSLTSTGSTSRTIAHHSSDAVNHTTKTWTLGNGAFTSLDVGATIVVTGSSTSNGTYVIASVTNATTIVTVTGPAGDETLAGGTSVALAAVAGRTLDVGASAKGL